MLGNIAKRSFKKSTNLSYVSGTSDIPLIHDTIGGLLRKQAKKYPNNAFQVFHQHGVEYSYKEFDQRVDEIAKGLIALGLQPGDRVGMYAPNRPEWALTQYACARADLILVNVNPAFQTDDLDYALNKVGIKTLIMQERFSQSHYVDIVRHLIPNLGAGGSTLVKSKRCPKLEHVVVCGKKRHKGMINFDELYHNYSNNDEHELWIREKNVDFESPTNIQFTSGTTGFPKGAALTHHNIVNNALMYGSIAEFSSDTRLCISVPLYHCMGMVMGSLSMLNFGGTAIYPCEGFKAPVNLEAIAKYECDSVIGVPSMFFTLIKEYKDNPGKYNIEKLNKGVIAGSICPEELLRN